MNKISIIIPVFNKFSFTKAAINDLVKLTNTELIVIDNASSDETQTELTKNNNIIYIRNEVNVFHSKACNQGFLIAKGDLILFLNNDIRIKSNYEKWTQKIIDFCYSTNGLVGPTMGQLDKNFNFIKEANEQLFGNSYLSGWCMAGTREVWNKLDIDGKGQIWSEEFPMYFNDGDLAWRCCQKKIPQTVISLPEIVHFGKISSSQLNVHKLYNVGRKKFIEKWQK